LKTAFVYTDRYFSYDYGDSHPLRIERLRLTHDLCEAYGLFDLPNTGRIETQPATEPEILRFHEPDYTEALKQASAGRLHGNYHFGLGPGDNPVFPGLWEWSLLHTGASLQCARLVSEGKARIAFNIAGGLHHAHPSQASGFCYVNDPVLAICHFLDRGDRVLYLDVDAHHGDGVQWAFYEEPRVLTVSFHQDGNTLFPGTGGLDETGRGTGIGYAVNVPMFPGTDDHVFWKGFSQVVPRVMEAFRPDVVVTQLGVDAFLTDPLASLKLTTNGFSRVIEYLTREGGAWVALGGGGYNPANVARSWTLAWAIMNGVELPDDLPAGMLPALNAQGGRGDRLRDPEHTSSWRARCEQYMDHCIAHLEAHVFSRIE
jgi:acetoin utilization protein AcuC